MSDINSGMTREKVENLARYHEIKPSHGYAERLADALNKIEGIEGDQTLSLIADLFREGIISVEEANVLTVAHVREISERP